jgi:hypothetical protein
LQTNQLSETTQGAFNVSRDYLKEASSIIFGDKISLGDLARINPDQVAGNLIAALGKARNPMQSSIRKAAAYGLGHLGDPRCLKQLIGFLAQEDAQGVREAMVAAITAIKVAPNPAHSASERCTIIDDVYAGRRSAEWD